MDTNLLKRITVNPEICHGKPTVRNTRYMVESIIEYLAGGDSIEDILEEFPELEKEDILACLAFAAKSIHFNPGCMKFLIDAHMRLSEIKKYCTKAAIIHNGKIDKVIELGPNTNLEAHFRKVAGEGS